jgi:hypothetical protein
LTWTFTTGTAANSVWNNSIVPAIASANDVSGVELGVKFRADVAGNVVGLRFYKGSLNTGTHVGHLWDSGGNLLATATFTGESATGWQQVLFSSPVAISAGTTYVASYYAPNGGYAYTGGYFAGSGADNGPLHALASGVDGANGLYMYESSSRFPSNSYNNTNYWVDVVFTASSSGLWQQSATAAFGSGTATNVAAGGGGIELAQVANLVDDFSGAALSTNWNVTSWTSQGGGNTNVLTSNSILSIQGAEVLSAQSYMNTPLEGSISFGAARYQNFGWSTGFSSVAGNYWAIFSTMGTTDTLFARVNSNGNTQDIMIGALPVGLHDYMIVPISTGFQFSLDGALQTTINIAFPTGTAASIAFSDFQGIAPLQADWVKVYQFASSGQFISAIIDAGASVAWSTANWTATIPTGTTMVIETQTSTDGVNWSAWTPVTNGGQIASPAGRYLRYEVLFTTIDPTLSAILYNIAFGWN